MNHLERELVKHEGLRLKPYRCTSDKLTIGIGRNLDDVGISEEEAVILLRNDIKNARKVLLAYFPFIGDLDNVRQDAMVNFCFNVGIGTVSKFKKALYALERKNYDKAADEMMDSKWARQVGSRALEVTEQVRSGKRATLPSY